MKYLRSGCSDVLICKCTRLMVMSRHVLGGQPYHSASLWAYCLCMETLGLHLMWGCLTFAWFADGLWTHREGLQAWQTNLFSRSLCWVCSYSRTPVDEALGRPFQDAVVTAVNSFYKQPLVEVEETEAEDQEEEGEGTGEAMDEGLSDKMQ